MSGFDVRAYRRAYYLAHRDEMLARSKARHRATYVPVQIDRRRKILPDHGLVAGTIEQQVRHLFGRDFKRHQIATLLCISRARVSQILNGRRGERGAMPRPKYFAHHRRSHHGQRP